MDYDMRLAALNLARDITPPSDAATLIANAQQIEQHLSGVYAKPKEQAQAALVEAALDWQATLPDRAPDKGEWSGLAHDLVRLFNTGSTIVNHARQVGMTTLLTAYAVSQLDQGKTVIFFSPTGSSSADLGRSIRTQTTEPAFERLTVLNLSKFMNNRPLCGKKCDVMIVDGLAFLPYGVETDFIATITPMAARCIFASTPGQDRGLFHDVWTNADNFFKVMLPYSTPLHVPHTPIGSDPHARFKDIRLQLGVERFANQFECVFRSAQDV